MVNNKKLKIAIFHLAFVYSGGGERLVLEEAIGLLKKGFEVTCFAPIINRKNCFPELMSQVKIKTFFSNLPLWIPDVEVFSILFSCIFAPFLFFKFKKYDYYFGANQPGAWISFVLSRINKIPYAIYLAMPTRLIHPRLIDQKTGLKIDDGFTTLNLLKNLFCPLISFLDAKSIRGTSLVFANGSYAKGILEQVYGIKAINCPAGAYIKTKPTVSGLTNDRFHGNILLNGKLIKKPYILITNRHFPQKKFEYAIKSTLMLKRKALNLVIAGKETEYTRELKRKFKNNKNIYFIGLLSEEELNKAYKNSLIYVYPSPEEDFGMGIVEAMSHGVPVVAWGNAGPTGIIKDMEDGLLARPFSIDDFSENIKRLLEDRKLYEKIAKNAYEKVKKYFTYDMHIKTLSDNIEEHITNWRKKKN